MLFVFTAPATPEIYTLSLHDALPICVGTGSRTRLRPRATIVPSAEAITAPMACDPAAYAAHASEIAACQDRKSTRLNSSHMSISYAVFCLKKKKKKA